MLRGGPPPLHHQTYNARNAASASAASGAPKLRSSSGHTLAASKAIKRPEMMARSQTGNLAHKLGLWSDVVTFSRFGEENLGTDHLVSDRKFYIRKPPEAKQPSARQHRCTPQLRPAYVSENHCGQYVVSGEVAAIWPPSKSTSTVTPFWRSLSETAQLPDCRRLPGLGVSQGG